MKKLLFIFLVLPTGMLFSAPPAHYYDQAEGQVSDNLRFALQSIIDGHYDVGYGGLYNVYVTSDTKPSGKVWDMYSTCTWTHGQKKCGSYSNVCDCYNREHSVPQSWFKEASPMVSDAFHIYPTDGQVNNQRSNYQFGECANGTTLTNGLGRLGQSTFPGYTSMTVFEPVDEYKGDFARTYFYMATRYADKCGDWGAAFNAAASNSGLSKYSISLFLKWHRQDPVSSKETVRNDAVYAKQHNRNPFIDNPELAEYIWGTHKGETWYEGITPIKQVEVQWLAISPNPATDYILVEAEGTVQMSYQLVDLSGKMLQSGQVASGEQISVTNLSNGIYLLKMDAGTKSTVQKVMVNR